MEPVVSTIKLIKDFILSYYKMLEAGCYLCYYFAISKLSFDLQTIDVLNNRVT